MRWRFDGVPGGDHASVQFPSDAGFIDLRFSPTWGGRVGGTQTATTTNALITCV
jgi:hypothetical protein